jgi:tetratricopeptide (TPR) repeat protein
MTAAAQGVLPAVHWRAYLALCLTALGDFARGRETAVEAGRLAERAGPDWSLAFARSALGVCDLQQGRAREACDSFTAALGLQRGADGGTRFMLPGAPIGNALALAGRRAEGLAYMESALRQAAARGFGTFRQRNLSSLARWRLREGQVADALTHAEEALRLARAQRLRAGEAWSLHLLAEVLGRLDGDEAAGRRALSACRDALARAEGLGMRPLAAQCQETLGTLLERTGDLDRARAARAAAAALRREIGLVARGA